VVPRGTDKRTVIPHLCPGQLSEMKKHAFVQQAPVNIVKYAIDPVAGQPDFHPGTSFMFDRRLHHTNLAGRNVVLAVKMVLAVEDLELHLDVRFAIVELDRGITVHEVRRVNDG